MFRFPKKAVFFDLDHTLWDFDRNAGETLTELFFRYGFNRYFGDTGAKLFIDTYNRHNQRLWQAYHLGQIDKATLRHLRFRNTFEELGVAPSLFPGQFELDYLEICPRKTHLFPHTHEILGYLRERYSLHLISNGFREACSVKIQGSNLIQYFDSVVISEEIGVLKPHPAIFRQALKNAGADKDDAVMIGDSLEADIAGAHNIGMEAVYFNPESKVVPADVVYTISSLDQLRKWL